MFENFINQARLTWRLLFDSRVPISSKMIPVGALLYVLSPIDIIPDIFMVFGQLDDLGLMLLSMRVFIQTVPPVIVDEHRLALGMDVETKPKRKRAKVVEGQATRGKRSSQKSKE